jgi:hypothetical protein
MAACTEMSGHVLLVAVLCCGNMAAGLPDVIRIGENSDQRRAFQFSVVQRVSRCPCYDISQRFAVRVIVQQPSAFFTEAARAPT